MATRDPGPACGAQDAAAARGPYRAGEGDAGVRALHAEQHLVAVVQEVVDFRAAVHQRLVPGLRHQAEVILGRGEDEDLPHVPAHARHGGGQHEGRQQGARRQHPSPPPPTRAALLPARAASPLPGPVAMATEPDVCAAARAVALALGHAHAQPLAAAGRGEAPEALAAAAVFSTGFRQVCVGSQSLLLILSADFS